MTHDEAFALIVRYSDEGAHAGIADELLDEAFALLADDEG